MVLVLTSASYFKFFWDWVMEMQLEQQLVSSYENEFNKRFY